MAVIYEPRGMAREYAALACNLYTGCTHGCLYCYAPDCLRRTPADFHRQGAARANILKQLAKEALAYRDSAERVLFCFTCDPYQPEETGLTRQALRIMVDAGAPFQMLTKGGSRACRDFDLYAYGRGWFGTTLVFTDDRDRAHWEPQAASVDDRIAALEEAHRQGIYTWVSVEPVVDPRQALALIAGLAPTVDEFRVGKLNHHPAASGVDWTAFGHEVYALLQDLGCNYLIKDSLARHVPPGAQRSKQCPSASIGAGTRPTTLTLV